MKQQQGGVGKTCFLSGISIRFKKNVRGSTLIEVIVGLFIICLSVAMSGVVFSQVMNSSYRFQKQKAFFLLNDVAVKSKQMNDLQSDELEFGNIRIVKEVLPIDESRKLYIIRLNAFAADQRHLGQKRLLWQVP